MPSLVIDPKDPSVLLTVANHLRHGEIKSVKIQKRKSGKNKGEWVADYTIRPAELVDVDRVNRLVSFLETAARAMTQNVVSEFIFIKDTETQYRRKLVTA